MTKKRSRGNGDADVWPRKNKEGKIIGYRGAYWVQTADGPKRRYVSGKTKQETRKALTEARADAARGIVFDAGSLTVGKYLEQWLPANVRDTVKQTTYESYERLIRLHLVPALGRVKLKNLTPSHVRMLYREKLDSGLSASSVQRVHALLHKALKQAVNDGLISRNVSEAVTVPKQSRKETETLTPEQARAFLEAARSDRLEALYLLAIHTGLRQGELLGLRWDDVDLEAGKLSVRRTLSTAKGGPAYTTPKNNKSRSVRLTEKAVETLRAHRKRQLKERMKLAGLWQDHGLVFCSQIGTPLSRHNVNTRSFKPLLKRAGLPHTFRFHDLRHSFATLMLSNGEHPKVVQEMLGHATITITMDTYSHMLPDMQDRAVDRLNAMLS